MVDVRTRRDDDVRDVEAGEFMEAELPALLEASPELLATTGDLDLRPLVIMVGESSWKLERGGDGIVRVGRAGPEDRRVLVLDEAMFRDLITDQITPVGLLTSGALDLRGTGIGRLMDWWLVLRSVLDRRPVHRAGDITVEEDPRRSFTLDDDPAEIGAFLETMGHLHLRGVYDRSEMDRISTEMDEAAPTHFDGDGRSWWVTVDGGERRLVRMQGFDRRSPAAAELLADDRLSAIYAMAGSGHGQRPRSRNRIEALFKPLGVREGISDVPWHRDCSLGRHSYDCASLTVGISVTGAGPGTGQLAVVAGSHRVHCWPSLLDVGSLGLPIVPLATETGDVTVHLSCTLHMAEPPTVAERRVLYTDAVLPPPDPEAAARARRLLYERSREAAPHTISQPDPDAPGR